MARISDPDSGFTRGNSDSDGGGDGGGGGGDDGGDELPDRTQDRLDRLEGTAPEPTDSDGGGGGGSGRDTGTTRSPRGATPDDPLGHRDDQQSGEGGGGGDDGGSGGGGGATPPQRPASRPSPGTRPGADRTQDTGSGTDLGSIDPSRVESATASARLLAAQRQAQSGTFNPENPYTPVGNTSGLERLLAPVTGADREELPERTQRNLGELDDRDFTTQTRDLDIDVGRDITVTGEGGEFGIRTTRQFEEEFQQQQLQDATQQIDARTQTDITTDDIIATGSGFRLTTSAQTQEARQRAAEELGVDPQFVDFSPSAPAGVQRAVREAGAPAVGGGVRLTEEFFERQLTEELDIAAEAGEDFTIEDTPTGQRVELTDEGRQDAITSELLDRGQVEVDREEATVPSALTFGREVQIGGDTRTIDIERASQLEFDEEGNLVDVQPATPTQAEEEAAEQRLANFIGGLDPISAGSPAIMPEADQAVGEAFADFAFGSRDLLQDAGDVSTDIGASYQQRVGEPTQELFSDLGGAAGEAVTAAALSTPEARIGLEEGTRREVQSEAVEGAQEQFRDVYRGRSAELIEAGSPVDEDAGLSDVEDVSADTAVGEQVGEFAGGVASLPRMAVELPQTAATGAELGGEAAAFTVQQPSEAPGAAADAAVNVGETIAVQTIQNPARVTGQLVGSAGVFRAARSAGPRTGLGTRLAIQPGEEILGYGGGGLFRRLPGDRTTRVGERLFPQNEPLIFSEEAAIRTAQRAGGAARRGGARLRTEVGRRTPELGTGRVGRGLAGEIERFRADTRAQLGAGEFETETETDDVITAEELDVDQEPIRPAEERTDIGEFERRRGQRRRREFEEESDFAMTDAERFALEQEVERNRQARSEGEEMLEEAQTPQVRAGEARFGTERRFETALGADGDILGSELLQETRGEEALMLSERPRAGVDTEVDVLGETRGELDQELGSEIESELESEAEQEAETETELESELEQEAESELELEIELESEGELESEVELFDERTEREEEAGFGLFAADEIFGSGIASAEDILGSDDNGDGNLL